MSEMKRIGGAGRKPYVWKDASQNRKRPAQPVRRVETFRSVTRAPQKTRSITATKPVLAMLGVSLIAAILITVVSVINMNAQRAKLDSLLRRQQDIKESILSESRHLEMETDASLICNKANSELKMEYPSAVIAINTGISSQTAER